MKEIRYPDVVLERYLLGELPEKKLEEIAQKEAVDAVLRARLQKLRASNEAILAEYRPEFIHQRIASAIPHARDRKKFRVRYLAIPAGAALTAAVIVLLSPVSLQHQTAMPPQTNTSVKVSEQTRFKGDDTKLFLYKKSDRGPEQIFSGAKAHEGEVIQLAYVSAHRYGIIFSVDGRGTVTLHFPADEHAPVDLGKGTTYLPSSYQLDDAPVCEQFYFIASDRPFDPDIILSKVRAHAHKGEVTSTTSFAQAGFSETSVFIEKESLK